MFQTLRRASTFGFHSLSVRPFALTGRDTLRNSLAAAAIVCAAWLSFGANSANAGSISYPGPLVGNTVIYSVDPTHSVTESSVTDPVPLFGAPILAGDSLDFNPIGFGSFAQNGAIDVTDGQLVFMVTAKPGQAINNIQFHEAGAVSLLGIGNAGTSASDKLSVFINIQEVNGVGINSINLGPSDFLPQPIFTPKGSFNLATDGNINLLPWSGKLDVNFAPFLVAHGFKATDRVTKISVNLDNQLLTTSQRGTSALMDKKDFFIIRTNTPEPASVVLALMGLVGTMLFARRRAG